MQFREITAVFEGVFADLFNNFSSSALVRLEYLLW